MTFFKELHLEMTNGAYISLKLRIHINASGFQKYFEITCYQINVDAKPWFSLGLLWVTYQTF